LQEIKKMHFDQAFIKQCCPSNFDEFVYVPSSGASSGLIIIWQSTMFSGMVMQLPLPYLFTSPLHIMHILSQI
jgi:hypothetical protein